MRVLLQDLPRRASLRQRKDRCTTRTAAIHCTNLARRQLRTVSRRSVCASFGPSTEDPLRCKMFRAVAMILRQKLPATHVHLDTPLVFFDVCSCELVQREKKSCADGSAAGKLREIAQLTAQLAKEKAPSAYQFRTAQHIIPSTLATARCFELHPPNNCNVMSARKLRVMFGADWNVQRKMRLPFAYRATRPQRPAFMYTCKTSDDSVIS